MEKYLYVFNYPPEERDLCALEFRALFKEEYLSKYYLSNIDYSVDQSVFMKAKVDIWSVDENFDRLIEKVKQLHYEFEEFKVIYLKNEISHVDYQETLQKCKDISWAIEGTVNMSKPKHIIAINSSCSLEKRFFNESKYCITDLQVLLL